MLCISKCTVPRQNLPTLVGAARQVMLPPRKGMMAHGISPNRKSLASLADKKRREESHRSSRDAESSRRHCWTTANRHPDVPHDPGFLPKRRPTAIYALEPFATLGLFSVRCQSLVKQQRCRHLGAWQPGCSSYPRRRAPVEPTDPAPSISGPWRGKN